MVSSHGPLPKLLANYFCFVGYGAQIKIRICYIGQLVCVWIKKEVYVKRLKMIYYEILDAKKC